MNSLLFGTAGIPNQCTGTTADGIQTVKSLGLGAMELEFVRSINIKKDKAPLINSIAQEQDIVLTCHAPFFINLNSAEKEKIEASKQRILNSTRILDACGGWSVCFHAGFYQKTPKEQTFQNIFKEIKEMEQVAKDEGLKPWIRPETTGKATQFGDIDELLKISALCEQVMPVIDFSHLHARTNGAYNTYDEFSAVLGKVEKTLGRKGLNNMHIHVAGIAYGEKGEKHHLNLKDSDFAYAPLLNALSDYKVRGVLICESPNIEQDALLMQQTYKEVNNG